jgi:PAS domain S-box-containing protein
VALARPITRSIVELRNHALALGRGDMENTVPASGPEEIKELAVAFNRMAEEVRSREVSLQKEHEKAVWLGRFPEQDPNPVFRVSADGVVLYCNTAAAAKSYGWNCEVGQLVQKDLLPLVSRALTEQEEVQQDLEIGGKIYVVWAVPFRAESYVNVYARDITERKEAEMKLEETGRSLESQRNLLQYIIDSTKNSHLVYLDRDFNFVRVNETYARTCGYTPQEMVGKNHFDLYPHKENEAIFVRVRDTGVPVEFHDKPFVFPDQPERGTTYWDWTLTPVKDPEGAVKGLVFSLFETTERKRMEEDLRKSRDELEERVRERTAELEKANTRLRQYNKRLEALNKELQDFAFVASHDLQEPLRKVRTFGDMLAANCGVSLDETSKNYIERMQRAAARMQDLINSLLSYSRLTTNSEPVDEIDLGESVKTALSNLEMIIRERNARVEVDDLPRVRADRVQMIQLFQNLIGNALKFHRDSQPPHVKIYSQQAEGKKRYHEIYIEDHGIGFDEKYLDKIFLPFQRLHGRNSEYDGVGMGLAICKKIVERHGGEITAKGELGKGSTFIVTLPSGRKLR